MTRTIIFDFDGTLALGDAPVRAYASAVAAATDAAFMPAVDAALTAFEAGASRYRDGYHIVGDLAAAHGASAEEIQRAYDHSRTLLGSEFPVDTIAHLPELLRELGQHATLILATNAPRTGVDTVLRAWGVDDLFDEQHFTVGKPDGLLPIASAAIERGPVLSIGDIYDLDLAPAAAVGADTALVGATAGTSPAPVTFRGDNLDSLRTTITSWAASADSSTTPLPAEASPER